MLDHRNVSFAPEQHLERFCKCLQYLYIQILILYHVGQAIEREIHEVFRSNNIEVAFWWVIKPKKKNLHRKSPGCR